MNSDQKMKTVLVIASTDLSRDPRVSRQIRFLSQTYQVLAVGAVPPRQNDVQFLSAASATARLKHTLKPTLHLVSQKYRPLSLLVRSSTKFYHTVSRIQSLPHRLQTSWRLRAQQYEAVYWNNSFVQRTLRQLSGVQADVIIANDIDTLPLALHLAQQNGSKVIFDAHEYAPRQFEDIPSWKASWQGYSSYLCATYIPRVDGMMTISPGVAEQYRQDTGVEAVVVTNAPFYADLEPLPRPETEQRIRLIHHGNVNQSRKIENMIDIMHLLDHRFELDMLLVGSDEAIEKLKHHACGNQRIRFLPPVAMQQLVPFLHNYDIGIHLLPPVNFNHRYTLPNKLLEFIQARLAVAIGPSDGMAPIVNEYDCGIVSDDFLPNSLAARLTQLDHRKINYYKQQSHKAARVLSAERNQQIVLDLVARVLESTADSFNRQKIPIS